MIFYYHPSDISYSTFSVAIGDDMLFPLIPEIC